MWHACATGRSRDRDWRLLVELLLDRGEHLNESDTLSPLSQGVALVEESTLFDVVMSDARHNLNLRRHLREAHAKNTVKINEISITSEIYLRFEVQRLLRHGQSDWDAPFLVAVGSLTHHYGLAENTLTLRNLHLTPIDERKQSQPIDH